MGMIKIYKCDICSGTVKHDEGLLGVRFSNLKNLTMGEYNTTDGTHICYCCARQLAEQLNRIDIKELLGIK